MDDNLWRSWVAVPGEALQKRSQEEHNDDSPPDGLPAVIEHIEIIPFPLSQGKTMVIKVTAPPDIAMSGSIAGQELIFFPQEDGYVTLQGIHTHIEPGAYPLTLEGQLANSSGFAFSQSVLVHSTDYIYDPMLIVDPKTVDLAVTEPENELWASLGASVTPDKMWDGPLFSPVPPELRECWTSFFVNSRAYNGSLYEYFHSGLDFCGRVGTELYAAAAGEVVFTRSQGMRGMSW